MADAQTISFKVLMDPGQAEQAQKTLNLSFDSLLQAVKKLDDTMIKMDRSLVVIGASMSKLHAPAKTTRDEIDKSTTSQKTHKDAVDKTAASVDKLGKSINRAGMANTNFNRVIQDSPYFFQSFSMGVMAIGNNLDPLMRSFKDLRDETGSWKGAMKSFVGSFTGGGGLLSVVSLAVSGFTALSLAFGKSEDKAKDNKKAVDELKSSLEKMTRASLQSMLAPLESERKALQLIADTRITNVGRSGQLYGPSKSPITDEQKTRLDYLNQQTKAINDQLYNLGDIDDVERRIAVNRERLNRLNKVNIKDYKDISDNYDVIASKLKQYINSDEELLKKSRSINEEIKKGNTGLQSGVEILTEASVLWDEIDSKIKASWQNPIKKKADDIMEIVKASELLNGVLNLSLNPNVPKELQTKNYNLYKAPLVDSNELVKSFMEDNSGYIETFQTIANSFGDTLADAGSEAFEKMVGEANSLFEKLLENIASGLFNLAGQNVSKNIFNGLLSLLPGGSIISDILGNRTQGNVTKIYIDGKEVAAAVVTPGTVNNALTTSERLRLA